MQIGKKWSVGKVDMGGVSGESGSNGRGWIVDGKSRLRRVKCM